MSIKLIIGETYNFKHQSERLMYVGTYGPWHQFKKIGDNRPVWAELLDDDLGLIEETKESL